MGRNQAGETQAGSGVNERGEEVINSPPRQEEQELTDPHPRSRVRAGDQIHDQYTRRQAPFGDRVFTRDCVMIAGPLCAPDSLCTSHWPAQHPTCQEPAKQPARPEPGAGHR